MNIIRRELKTNLKPFAFWTAGLFILTFVGMTKYLGVGAEGVDLNAISDRFPRVILAFIGMADADTRTLSGFYAVIAYFAAICVSLYSLSLGFNAVSREAADKTYEFLFTKPRKRRDILSAKLGAAVILITLFNLLNCVFPLAAASALGFREDISREVLLFYAAAYLVSMLFFSISVLLSVLAREAEQGARRANLVFVFAFVMGVVCDTLENPGALRLLSPLRYFATSELLSGRLSPSYAALCILLTVATGALAIRLFERKDLTAA